MFSLPAEGDVALDMSSCHVLKEAVRSLPVLTFPPHICLMFLYAGLKHFIMLGKPVYLDDIFPLNRSFSQVHTFSIIKHTVDLLVISLCFNFIVLTRCMTNYSLKLNVIL